MLPICYLAMKLNNQNIYKVKYTGVIWDEDIKGFGLRIHPSGKKVYILQIRDKNKIQHKQTIGDINQIKLKDAKLLAKKTISKCLLGENPFEKDKSILFKDFINQYIEKVSSKTKSMKSQLNEKSLYKLYLLPYFGNLKLTEVTSNKIRRLMFDMSNKPIMANKAYNLISHMFNMAIEWGLAESNPIKRIKKFPEERRNIFLNFKQIKELLNVLELDGSKTSLAIKMMILTGARKSEVLNATFEQFDLTNNYWNKPCNTTKQRKTHTIPIGIKVIHIVEQLKKMSKNNFLFSNYKGKPMIDIKRKWHVIRNQIKMPHLRLHDLRHSFASFMVNKGVPIRHISELLGHTNIQTTLRYAHVFDESLKKAVNLI